MNVDYNDAGTPPKATTAPAEEELTPEEAAVNAQEGKKEAEAKETSSRRRPGCDGYVTVNEDDAW
jgi:DNA-directed RNA polymerase beta subunit